ncbi:hypothetical protein EBR21_13895, partial [bacterium]|nr:hypothetical protein [bacterium]
MGTGMETSGNRTALGVTSDIAQQVGARLRRARESIGRSTSALSAKIKVREHYLVAIEDGEWNELPPGLNGRGLVRIYARELSVSVPELDQAANQTVMPAEQDAQAPYQIGGNKKEGGAEREIPVVRVALEHSGISGAAARTAEQPVRTNTLNTGARAVRATDSHNTHSKVAAAQPSVTHRMIESTPEEEPLDVVTPDVASILGITLDTIDERPQPQNIRPMSAAPATVVAMHERSEPTPVQTETTVTEAAVMAVVSEELQVSQNTHVESVNTELQPVNLVAAESLAPSTNDQTLSSVVDKKEATAVPAVDESKSSHQHSHKKNKKHNRSRSDREEKQASQAEPTHIADAQSAVAMVEVKVESSLVGAVAAENSATMSVNPSTAVDDSVKEAKHQARQPAAEATTETQGSIGVSAAEQYLKNHSQPMDSEEDVQTASSKAPSSLGLRVAVGLMAACVLVFIVGRLALREPAQPSNPEGSTTAVDAEGGKKAAIEDQAPTEAKTNAANVAAGKENAAGEKSGDAAATAPNDTKPISATGAETTITDSNSSKTTPQQTASTTNDSTAASAAAESEQESVDQAENAAAKPTTKVESTGSTAAVLVLSEPI